MLRVDDVGIAIADVYARALLELAASTGDQAFTLEELDNLVAYVNAHPEFEAFLTGVTVDADSRHASLEKMLRGKVSDLLLDFLQVLNDKDRLPLLEQAFIQYRLAYEKMQNQVEVTVRSATPLSARSRDSLVNALKSHTGADPILTEEVDPSLIGGLLVYVGDEKIDFSVQRKLGRFHDALMKRASQEIHGGRSYFREA